MYKVGKDGQSAFLQVIFLFWRMMHCVKVRVIMKEKERKKKGLLLPIYFKCASYICLYILWYLLTHLQLSCAEIEIGNNVKCRIRTKTNNTQKFERENDLYRMPNSCMWSRSLLEQDKGCILCPVKCSLQEHWCRAKCKRGTDRSVQLMSASYLSITQCARDQHLGLFDVQPGWLNVNIQKK